MSLTVFLSNLRERTCQLTPITAKMPKSMRNFGKATDHEPCSLGAKALIMSTVSIHLFNVLFSLSILMYHGHMVICPGVLSISSSVSPWVYVKAMVSNEIKAKIPQAL